MLIGQLYVFDFPHVLPHPVILLCPNSFPVRQVAAPAAVLSSTVPARVKSLDVALKTYRICFSMKQIQMVIRMMSSSLSKSSKSFRAVIRFRAVFWLPEEIGSGSKVLGGG
jgi:hypothetical protein